MIARLGVAAGRGWEGFTINCKKTAAESNKEPNDLTVCWLQYLARRIALEAALFLIGGRERETKNKNKNLPSLGFARIDTVGED